jgi:hypothetical protein
VDKERRHNRFQRKQAYKQKAKREWLSKCHDDSDIPVFVDIKAAILSGETVVVLEEEYGYRTWVWKPGLTFQELETFWAGMEKVHHHFFNPSKTLPGDFIQAIGQAEEYWFRLYSAENYTYYKAHIHEDSDSFLKAPDGRTIFHKGYGREDG